MKLFSIYNCEELKYGIALLFLFIFLSSSSVIFDLYTGYINGDITTHRISAGYDYVSTAIVCVLISIIACVFFTYIYSALPKIRHESTHLSIYYKYVIIFLCALYLITNVVVMYAAIIPEYAVRGLVLTSALLQPGIVILSYLYKNFEKYSFSWCYKGIAAIYFVASFISGFMWSYIPLIILLATKIKKGYFIILVLIAALILPVGRIFKYILYSRISFIDSLKTVFADIFTFISQSYMTVFSHFNLAQNVYFAKLHVHEIYSLAVRHEYLPWFQGYFGSLAHKLFYDLNAPKSLNQEIAALINQKTTWAVALPSHLFVSNFDEMSLLILAYTFVEIFVVAAFSKFVIGGEYGFLFSSIMLCELIMPGWHWPISNLVQGLLVFALINKLGIKINVYKS